MARTLSPHRIGSEALLQVLTRTSAAVCVFRGPQFIYEFLSDEYRRWAGKDCLGQSLFEAFPEQRNHRIVQLLEQAYKEGKPIRLRSELLANRNELGVLQPAYLDIDIEPFFDNEGQVAGVLHTVIDVTEICQARNAVANERENFRKLFEQTPEMFCILRGPEHKFEFVNDAHIKALGFDATGLTVGEAQPESKEVYALLDQVYRTGVTFQSLEVPVTVTDRLRYFNLTYSARRDEKGAIIGVMICGVEVTEQVQTRERMRENEERLKLALASSQIGFFDWDIHRNSFLNDRQFMADWGLSEPLKNLEEGLSLIHPEDRDRIFKRIEECKVTGEPFAVEYRVKRPNDGRTVWFDIKGEVQSNEAGEPIRFIGTCIDITARKQVEEEARKAKEAAESASRMKSAFLANMSHEIRTPLGAILGFSDLLADPDIDSQEKESFHAIIQRNGEQLSNLIDDILDLSKIEAGELRVETCRYSVRGLVEEVHSLLQLKAKEKNLDFTFSISPQVPMVIETDPTRVRQILTNALGNAIKFTSHGFVHLKVDREGSSHQIQFTIEDSGIGIAESQIPKLFKPFSQADTSITRKYGGTGLGLALSQKLAQALGGDLILKSTKSGEGSVFELRIRDHLKVSPSLLLNRNETSVETGARILKTLKVLLVDDATDNQFMISRMIRKNEAQVEIANNGLEGVHKAMSGDYDLILMDLQMPEMDGYTATQILRERGYSKPIIALTAHAMNETRVKCLNVGCTDYLTKPIGPKELWGKISQHTAPVH